MTQSVKRQAVRRTAIGPRFQALKGEGFRAAQALRLLPALHAVSDKLSIMKTAVTVDLFKLAMGGYKFTGHGADKLKAVLADPARTQTPQNYVSLLDAREFAKRLSALTGRRFRVQTEAEWMASKEKLMAKQYNWVEEANSGYGNVVFRSLSFIYQEHFDPARRYPNVAIRLVEER